MVHVTIYSFCTCIVQISEGVPVHYMYVNSIGHIETCLCLGDIFSYRAQIILDHMLIFL